MFKQKSAAVFAVRRANYTHRRKGVFNVQSIEDLKGAWQRAIPHRCLLNNVKKLSITQDFPDLKTVRERTDIAVPREYISRTQQAGWPWSTCPSRLTLRNTCRPGFSSIVIPVQASRCNANAKYPSCPLHRGP